MSVGWFAVTPQGCVLGWTGLGRRCCPASCPTSVSDNTLAAVPVLALLYVICLFPLAALKIFSLVFSDLAMICRGVVLFPIGDVELLESVHLGLSPNLGKFQPLFFQIFSLSHPFLPWDPN